MQYINIIFFCNEELKGGMQGYSLCLLGNQLKFKLGFRSDPLIMLYFLMCMYFDRVMNKYV